MNKELSNFAARLRGLISNRQSTIGNRQFSELALELFALQFKHNAAYQKICEARGVTPEVIEHWTKIPTVPTVAFKELELSCLASQEWSVVFHSSGTTEQNPSRHYHNTESLAVYEASLWSWFAQHVVPEFGILILTPPPVQAPHSSLVHMFETIRRRLNAPESAFVGGIASDGSWVLDFDAVLMALKANSKFEIQNPKLILGTAFSFVHLLDFLGEHDLRFELPSGSRVMETGGYKNRSRTMPKAELHALITERLGIEPENIICEYGMSELSSQAYDEEVRRFHFPPWARAQIISPETSREVADGETGLVRVFDLANVYSVMAVQTADLAVRCGDGFELMGRARVTEPRGCSLMSA